MAAMNPDEMPIGGASSAECPSAAPPADAPPPRKKFQPKAVSADDALLKDIKIKTGICKRLVKELGFYKTETGKLQAVIAKLEAEGACEHDIKKQKEVLEENTNIVPSAILRLQQAYEDIYALCDESEENPKIAESEEFKTAKEVIASAEACEEVVA